MKKFSRLGAFGLFTLVAVVGCSAENGTVDNAVDVSAGAAFTSLQRADVYDENGIFLTTLDGSTDFKARLPAGHYHVDFVDEAGGHSFTDDGRMAFVPTMQGGLPVGGPVVLRGVDAKLWEVDIDPALEANAHLMERVRAGDPTLQPWASVLGMESARDERGGEDGSPDIGVLRSGLHTFGGNVAAMRSRVIWELSFAMKGDFAVGCNNAESCWQGTLFSGTSYYALATAGKINPYTSTTYYSYIDYDTTAWSSARTAYGPTSGNVSCKDSGSSGCSPTIGSSNATTYTCQASSCTTSTHPKGGECKVFQNLVLFRAGIMHAAASSTTWLTLPSDASVSGGSYSYETAGTIQVGDALRDTSPIHSTIVVYAAAGGTYRVVDSNWVGTTSAPQVYAENIGSHILSFSGSGISNLGNYKNMTCVYNSGDSRCP